MKYFLHLTHPSCPTCPISGASLLSVLSSTRTGTPPGNYQPPTVIMSSATSKPKVLLLGSIDQYPSPPPSRISYHPLPSTDHLTSQTARDSYDSLSSLADLITPRSTNRDDFIKEAKSGAFDGVRAAYRTFQSVSITGRIEGEVCEVLGKAGLRFLAHNGMLERLLLFGL